MTTGAVQLAMNRTRITRDGEELAKSATVTVMGGEAVAVDHTIGVELRMRVVGLTRTRRTATITGEDGTVWELARNGCGCGQ